MPGKMARSAPLPPFRVPGVTAVIRAASLSCQNAGKPQKFRPVRGASGEFRNKFNLTKLAWRRATWLG
jgi:hypothetical protein